MHLPWRHKMAQTCSCISTQPFTAHTISPFLQVRRHEKHLQPQQVGDTLGDVQPALQEVKKRRPTFLSYAQASCYGQKLPVTQWVPSWGRRGQEVQGEGTGRRQELAREDPRLETGCVQGLSTHPCPTCESR